MRVNPVNSFSSTNRTNSVNFGQTGFVTGTLKEIDRFCNAMNDYVETCETMPLAVRNGKTTVFIATGAGDRARLKYAERSGDLAELFAAATKHKKLDENITDDGYYLAAQEF